MDLPPAVELLAFAPHPDDVELWAGGLMLRAADLGYRVAVVDLTEGEAASRGDLETRSRERDRASALMGLAARESLGLPDTKLEATPEMTAPLTAAIRRWRPRLVVGPDGDDLHPDHAAAAALVRRAYYLAAIAAAEGGELPPHRPDALVAYLGQKERTPSFVVDVSEVWERRVELACCYASQVGVDGAGGPPTNLSTDFLRRLETRAAYWGSRIGAAFGEPYVTDRLLPIDDPVAAFRKRGDLIL